MNAPVLRVRSLPPLIQPLLAQGRGLNSIPIRFALLAAVCSTLCVLALTQLAPAARDDLSAGLAVAFFALTILVPSAVTFLAARKLTGAILALRRSTEAIAAGDINSPVDVDCACEVGGLADSFRAMIQRLNGNILRMNVLAYADPVTQLPNRAVVNHVLGLLKRSPEAPACRGALVLLDLDGFKRVNDTLGHGAGDELLRLVADRLITQGLDSRRALLEDCTTGFGELRETCPERPILARLGGDTFLILLPGVVEMPALAAITDRLAGCLAAPFPLGGTALHVSASFGVARLPEDTTDPDQLLGHAELAMYAAKEAGRNCVRFFDATLHDASLDRARIEIELHRAIAQDELELHYQPKLACRGGTLTGAEALVRWRHPTEGMIMPARFVAAAEQSGQMLALGACVLRLAARQLRDWQARGIELKIAVNVSAVQLEHAGFVDEVLGILAIQGVDPHRLELEVTESMVMAGVDSVRARLDQLRAAGLRIAIDDFGTGYSNLSQIAALPSDALKLDRSLVTGLGQDAKAGAIVAASIGMAHALGHRVIAEGVEDTQQLAALAEAGCDEAQGFLIARPMPAAALEQWMAGRTGLAQAAE